MMKTLEQMITQEAGYVQMKNPWVRTIRKG